MTTPPTHPGTAPTRPRTEPSHPRTAPTPAGRVPLWVGTYPVAGAGTPAGLGEGIWLVDLDPVDGTLHDARQVVESPSPSFVLPHPAGGVLYAVDESQEGTVTLFAVEAGGLRALATVGSGGAYPCHLALDEDGRTLLVANYASGTLGVLPLAADGTFDAEVLETGGPVQVFGHAGSGPVADRQEGPHAHFAVTAPGERHVLVVDLGTDEVRRYARDPRTRRLAPAGIAATLPAGTGPRHLAFSDDGAWAYVVGELDGAVHVLAWDARTATGTVATSVRTTADGRRPGATTDLQVSRTGADAGGATAPSSLGAPVVLDGDRLLVGVRGADVIAEHRTDPVPGGPGLRHRADHPLPGSWPRHHAVVAGWVVVAQQVDGGLVALAPDGSVVGGASVPAPTCVAPARRRSSRAHPSASA